MWFNCSHHMLESTGVAILVVLIMATNIVKRLIFTIGIPNCCNNMLISSGSRLLTYSKIQTTESTASGLVNYLTPTTTSITPDSPSKFSNALPITVPTTGDAQACA